MKSHLYLLLGLFLFAPLAVWGQSQESDLTKKKLIGALLNRYEALQRFSGRIRIEKDGKLWYQESVGYADFESQLAFTEKTAFKIGQLSEFYLCLVLEQLIEEGKIKLSDPLGKFFPSLKKHQNITLLSLLKQESQLPSIAQIQKNNPDLTYQTLAFLEQADLNPKARYSELNYNLIGEIIQQMLQKSPNDLIESYLVKPLGLENSYYEKPNPAIKGYLYKTNQQGQLATVSTASYPLEKIMYSQGMKSSIRDLSQVGQTFLQSKLAALLGYEPGLAFQKDGYTAHDGFSYLFFYEPREKLNISILSNRRHPVGDEMAKSIRAILNGKPYRLPLLRKEISLPPAELDKFVGSYAVNPQFTFKISKEETGLFVQFGPNKSKLYAQAKNQLFIKEVDAAMRFSKNEKGEIIEVTLLDGFIDGMTAKKVE